MLFLRCLTLFLLSILAGCASTNEKASTEEITDYNAEFNRLVAKLKNSPESLSYEKLWHTYLKSDQINNTGIKQDEYMQLVHKLDSGELSCKDIDWDDVTHQNFWSIKPHISAQSCYESLGDSDRASFHAYVVEFLLTGILSNGDGENYYSAYEIATWGDASDVIEFSGYEIVDSYLELKHYGQALYFIYVVNDPETGFQKEIYFENNKFLHEIMNIQYPFASIDNKLKTNIIDLYSKSHTNAKMAKAITLISERKYDDAVDMYLSAINDGSAIANYRLGILCHSKKQTTIPLPDCTNYLFQAAEMGYLNASIAIAFLYKEGIGVEKNEQIFSEIMSSVEQHFELGDAWFKLALFYNNIFGIKNEVNYRKYLDKASVLGSLKAEYAGIMLDTQKVDDKDKKQIDSITNRLRILAEKGLDTAQVTYANILIRTNNKGSEKWNEAKVWIEKAAEQNNPFAYHLLGNAYQYDYFGEKDLLKAYFAYNEAALNYYPDSQLQIGYFNDIGKVVEMDKSLAMSWYFLCSSANNLTCTRNLGTFFENGHAVEKNIEIAAQLYSQGCNKKDGGACSYLGNLYREGAGTSIKQNHNKANELFQLSCDYGYTRGCNNLANAYHNGWGVTKDTNQAANLYRNACEIGDHRSCVYLGSMYRYGNGLQQDINQAKELYLKACNGGDELGCTNYRGAM